MTTSLPSAPSLINLKMQAKSLLKAHRKGDPSCCEVLRHLKDQRGKTDDQILSDDLSLTGVQHALAMEYGFPTWAAMKVAVSTPQLSGMADGVKVALLINDRESRQALVGKIEEWGGTADEYPTAAKAMDMFGATRYDLIVVHWQVYPGQKASDPKVRELAAMIPVVKFNRNVLYWETALRVIDTIRMDPSPNRATPLMVIFPNLGLSSFESGDQLARESVESDLASRQPATLIAEASRDKVVERLAQNIAAARSG
jgi:hypothetical protein